MRAVTDVPLKTNQEIARWAKLWKMLGLRHDYRPRCHTIKRPDPGCYKAIQGEYSYDYRPDFFVHGINCYVDLVPHKPEADVLVCAAQMFQVTGYPIAMFQLPLFVPNWKTFAPMATMCREVAAKRKYFLQYRHGRVQIGPAQNEHDVVCPFMQRAVTRAMSY